MAEAGSSQGRVTEAPAAQTAAVEAEAETISAIGRFRVATLRETQVRLVVRRAKQAPKALAHGAHPVWDPRVAAVAGVHVEAADAGGNQSMNKEKYMKYKNLYPLSIKNLSALLVIAACFVLATAFPAASQTKAATSVATQPPQKTFDTPQQAADAMILAVKNDDVTALLAIFGPAGKDFVASGDDIQDKNSRANFATQAQEKMHVDTDPHNPNRAIISIGDEDWPLPVPIVKQNGKWHFDSKAGRNEIVNRRIGENELVAITICRGYDDAQKEYAEQIHDDSGVNQYAQRIISSPGKHDGLAWQNPDGSWGGTVGEKLAKELEAGGYKEQGVPFHGYYFKTLKGQGPSAPLGQLDYVIEGAMIGGFALVAVPAQYRVTGVMTFMVSYDGVVYQKDLGPDSVEIVKKMERYNPDKSWHRTDDDL